MIGQIVVGITASNRSASVLVGPCHHGMARPQVADMGTASDTEGSCELQLAIYLHLLNRERKYCASILE